MPNKKILVLCWDFPPNNGIGGRRWAKLTKYLVKLNFECHVIKCAKDLKSKNSSWTADVQSDNIKVYNIKPYFLTKWLNGTSTGFKKIKFFIANKLMPLKFKGTIYDKAIGIENEIIKTAQEIIDENQIKYIIVTGAPFNLLFYSAKLLKNNPQLISLADYRDPWITAVNYGMQGLSPSRKKVEEEKQNFVLNQFTYVSAPNTFLLKDIEASYTGQTAIKSKFIEIAHAFDIDDYGNDILLHNSVQKTNTIKIVYGGAMYLGVENYIQAFSQAIKDYQLTFSTKIIEAIFYTEDYKKYETIYDNLIFKPSVGDNFFKVVKEADFLLVLLANHNKDFKTTKYYEYMPINKPYIYIGPEGFVSDSIKNDQIGYVLSNVSDDFKKIINTENALKRSNSIQELINIHSFSNRAEVIKSIFT